MKNIILISILLIISIYTSIVQAADLFPIGGEQFYSGETILIKWHYYDYEGDVKISIFDGNKFTWSDITTIDNSIGSYQWFIPYHVFGNKFRIKIEAIDGKDLTRLSNTFFSIKPNFIEKKAQEEAQSLNNNRFSFYPNPASDYIELSDLLLKTELNNIPRIFNIYGKEFTDSSIKISEKRIDISNLNPGIYFLRIGSKSFKFVKI